MATKGLITKLSVVAKFMDAAKNPELLQCYMTLQTDAFALIEELKEKNKPLRYTMLYGKSHI